MGKIINKILFFGLLFAVNSIQAKVIIHKLEPTVLFPNKDPLCQIALLHVENTANALLDLNVEIKIDNQVYFQKPQTIEIAPGFSEHNILIPDLEQQQSLQLKLLTRDNNSVLADYNTQWQPQRHWKVYVVHSSHEDLGYEDYIYKKQYDIANFIDLAYDMSRWFDRPYHYTLESLLFMRNYIDERSDAEWRHLVENGIKKDVMHLMGEPHGVHTHWMDYEELIRMTYGARREVKDRYDLDIKTFLMVDNPGISWSACQALAGAGFKYVALWANPFRSGDHVNYTSTKCPPIFWWKAPDQKHKLLFSWRTTYSIPFWYGQTGTGDRDYLALAGRHVSQRLEQIEKGITLGPYPYDAVIIPAYTDHDIPDTDHTITKWNQMYRYPEIKVESPERFFEYVENTFRDQIPVLSGDMNSFWADYTSIDPQSQGWKRTAARLLPVAEGLSALASVFDRSYTYPKQRLNQSYQRLFDYVEHCWPTLRQDYDVQSFNTQWGKTHQARRTLESTREMVAESFTCLASKIKNKSGRKIVVFNPLGHKKAGIVRVDLPKGSLYDINEKQWINTQQSANGKTVFLAKNVPAFGYKSYRIDSEIENDKANRTKIGSDWIENRFYRISFDQTTGAINSITDKDLQTQLVDKNAPYLFNQMVYVHKEGVTSKSGKQKTFRGRARLIPGSVGPVMTTFTTQMDDSITGARITQEVILYDQLKRIDIINTLKDVDVMYSDEYKDRYKENLFYAFPVRVEDFNFHVEYPGGVVRPYMDQLRLGSHDYLCVNRWMDVSNDEYGVSIIPWDAPCVHLGDIRYNKFSIDYQPTSSHVYSYFGSNRMAGLLTLAKEDCDYKIRYSLTSHSKNWKNAQVPFWGWQTASPLQARVIDGMQDGPLSENTASFIQIHSPNVQLVTLKQSEQPGKGFIIRLVETSGQSGKVMVSLSSLLHFSGASLCNLVEEDVQTLDIRDKKITVPIDAFGYCTIRLYNQTHLPEIQNLSAKALSDSRIRLEWKTNNTTSGHYYVYRSEDLAEPPTAYSLIARTTEPEYIDSGLKIDAQYGYYVSSATPDNQQGPMSKQIRIRTDKKNTSPPNPVTGLGVVRHREPALTVYWNENKDPDVAQYLVYRSTYRTMQNKVLVAKIKPTDYFLQLYRDNDLEPGQRYYYKVFVRDWAGLVQTHSKVVWANVVNSK